MTEVNRIVIIGAGNVGTAALSAVVTSNIASEVIMVDINSQKAEGEATDLSDTTSFNYTPNVKIRCGTYEDCAHAQAIIITAGPSISNPNESRTALANKNSKVISSVMGSISKYTTDAIIVLVTNPLDVVTYLAHKSCNYPANKIIGTGTLLDTARFRRILADKYSIDPKNVHGYILGEHGSTAFVTWSLVNIAGMKIESFEKALGKSILDEKDGILDYTKKRGFEIVEKKGSTSFGVAGAAQRIVRAVLLDEKCVLPVSTVLYGQYGLTDIALSVPCIIGKNGVEKILELPLTNEETASLNKSADYIKSILNNIKD